MIDMENKNLLVYAYLGDATYEIMTRKYLISKNISKVNDLKKESLLFVSAKRQDYYLKKMKEENFFTLEELELLRRGRNVKTNSKPKYCSILTYKHATSLEILFGVLDYGKKYERLEEIFKEIIRICEENKDVSVWEK